jgi:hypothetical protein
MFVTCPLCAGRQGAVAVKEHNLRCADYGERVYLGRDDPRMPVTYKKTFMRKPNDR